MSTEQVMLLSMWLLGVSFTAILVPRRKLRLFIVAFLAGQLVVWVAMVALLEFKLIAYPIREFPKATNMGFTTEFMLYPVLCGLYMIYEPQRGWARRALYLLAWSCGFGLIQYGIAAGTELLDYVRFNWLAAGLVFACVLVMTNSLVVLYRRSPAIPGEKSDL